MKRLSLFFKKYWPIIIISAFALFLRIYRISDYMTFLGDEGRDALVWLRMSRGKFTLIGPQTSIGNMYLGPLFYYLMFPFYLTFGAVGPSLGTAFFGGATTFLLWRAARSWFSERLGLLSAFLYAISPVAIVLSRSAWNPNIMPFFALLSVWGVWRIWKENDFLWLPVLGFTLSAVFQSHYLGLLLFPAVGLFILLKLISIFKKNNPQRKKYVLLTFLSIFLFFFFSIVPLVWFDLRHDFLNLKAFGRFFFEGESSLNFYFPDIFLKTWLNWKTLFSRLLTGKDETFGLIFSLISLFLLILIFILSFKTKKWAKEKQPLFLLIVWIFFGLIGLSLYKYQIYDHYFGFLFPAVFIVGALIIDFLWRLSLPAKVFSLILFILIVIYSFKENPLGYPPNFQYVRTKKISEKIAEIVGKDSFNLGMIAKRNHDAGYRYFLELWRTNLRTIDAQKANETITEQLFVICEDKECEPINHPQAEIASFGWAKIEEQWVFPWGTKLFKLAHVVK